MATHTGIIHTIVVALIAAIATVGTMLVTAEGSLSRSAEGSYTWRLPLGFPEPRVPDDNPMSDVKVKLGRLLFYDQRLSSTQTISCATCHQQALAFTDGLPASIGETGTVLARGAMSLVNLAYRESLGWANPHSTQLELQMQMPLFSQAPIEMGARGNEQLILDRLFEDPRYTTLFIDAFAVEQSPLSWENIIKAIAAFERTLISGDSDYDRWLFSDIRPEEQIVRGLFLFSKLGCDGCHGGIGFNNEFSFNERRSAEFHFTGLVGPDLGLAAIDPAPANRYKFKAPTLRNIAVTAPYMHDGRFDNLTQVIAHYASGPAPEVGLAGFSLTDKETLALIAFLHSLTDATFLTDINSGPP